MPERMTIQGPHQGQPVLNAGKPLGQAKAAMILVHGRGATAQSILTLADEFQSKILGAKRIGQPDFAYLAPQAAGNSWYPYSFLAPLAENEPGLSSGLAALAAVLAEIEQAGISPEKTILVGFSQGACLALEFAARNPRRYGGLVAFSGGLIGPPGTPRDYPGTLEGTPVFLGCSDIDFHIPLERVHESAAVMKGLGGEVTERIYPNMGHTINQDEINQVQTMMQALV